jgi:hypothetical protein
MAQSVRDRAVVSLTFDDVPASGVSSVSDTAKAGNGPDAVSLPAGATRLPSVFVPDQQGFGLLLEPSRKQLVSIAHSADVSRPEAVTISGLFAGLHPVREATFRGLFAKRAAEVTNYGINFIPQSDVLQLYVNDGSGYRVAKYSVKAVLGFRRRVHIAAALDAADAGGQDTDTDADDVRVRLFVNGALLTPTGVDGGFNEGGVAWFTGTALSKCLNEAPLVIGASTPDLEHMRLVVDDVHVFAEALSDADAAALFTEITGPAAQMIAAEQSAPAADHRGPVARLVEPQAVRIGVTSRVSVSGKRLSDAELHLGITGATATRIVEESSDSRAVFQVASQADVVPGRYPIRVVTPEGASNAIVLAVDNLGTQSDGTLSEQSPAESLPAAVAGVISGTEQRRLWFRGRAGQSVTAEVEARRVGSKLDPVVEIRSAAGTPLAIQWQQPELAGDARTTAVLPTDGLYYAEVHDLQFQAPRGSPWRLIVGELPPSAFTFPEASAGGATTVRTLGGGSASSGTFAIRMESENAVLAGASPLLPLPRLQRLSGREVVEPVDGTMPVAPIAATFLEPPFAPVVVIGRIAARGEADSVLLHVTPGQSLSLAASARRLRSSLRARIAVLNGDSVIAAHDGESGAVDPALTVTVPDGVTQLKVKIDDVNGSGSPSALYRLEIARADRTAFVLRCHEESVRLPDDGAVPVRLEITRSSPSFRYTGPIRLSVEGENSLVVVPDVIPASEQNQDVFVMLSRQTRAGVPMNGQSLTIVARSEGADPLFTTTAVVPQDSVPADSLTFGSTRLLAAPAQPVPAVLVPDALPPVLLRGTTTAMPVRVISRGEHPPFVRFSLTTTEPVRRDNPKQPDSPEKPRVRLDDLAFAQISADTIPVAIHVPLDTPSSMIDVLLSAELVPHPLAAGSAGRLWLAPMSLSIADAVSLSMPAEGFQGTKAATITMTIPVTRHPLFADAVSVELAGLPEGFTTAAAPVAAGESQAVLSVNVPESATAGPIPNLTLTVRGTDGQPLTPPMPLAVTVQ